MTGFDVAYALSPERTTILHSGVQDWYNPNTKTIFLSLYTYFGLSVKAKATAAHESAHALQHEERSWLFLIRKSWPVQSARLPYVYLLVTLMAVPFNILLATALFLGMFLLAEARRMVIRAIERDASKRAVKLLLSNGFITDDEREDAETWLAECEATYHTV